MEDESVKSEEHQSLEEMDSDSGENENSPGNGESELDDQEVDD